MVLFGSTSIAHEGDLDQVNAEVVRLYKAGKYAEAVPIAKRVLKITETAPPALIIPVLN